MEYFILRMYGQFAASRLLTNCLQTQVVVVAVAMTGETAVVVAVVAAMTGETAEVATGTVAEAEVGTDMVVAVVVVVHEGVS